MAQVSSPQYVSKLAHIRSRSGPLLPLTFTTAQCQLIILCAPISLMGGDPLEGTNIKIKTMKRQAYVFQDKELFKLKIMSIHKVRHTLVGCNVICLDLPLIMRKNVKQLNFRGDDVK